MKTTVRFLIGFLAIMGSAKALVVDVFEKSLQS
jgi:hypothetical protein